MWISEISIDKKYENEFGYLANGLKDIKNLSFAKETAKRRYIFSVAAADEYEQDVKEDILRLVKNVILIFIKRRILFEGLNFDANTYVKITALASITHFDSYYEEKYLEYQLKDMVDYNVDAIFNFRLQKLKSNWQELRSLTESLLYYADNEDLTYIASFMNSTSKERVDKLTVSGGNGEAMLAICGSSSLHSNQADEAFMRVGDKSRKLTFDERVQLMYDNGERSFEDTAVYGATIDDIDMDAVTRYINLLGYSKSPLDYLRENSHFVTTNKNGEEVVSVACMLLFGKKPQLFFPRARTRFIRYNGVDEKVGTEMNVIKDVTFEGGILHQIEKTVEYLETQVAEHTFLGQAGKFVTRRDYPKFVIQEMVVNACCHRAYNI